MRISAFLEISIDDVGCRDWLVVPRAAHHARVGSSVRNRIVDARRRTELVLHSREWDCVAGAERTVVQRNTEARFDFNDGELVSPEE